MGQKASVSASVRGRVSAWDCVGPPGSAWVRVGPCRCPCQSVRGTLRLSIWVRVSARVGASSGSGPVWVCVGPRQCPCHCGDRGLVWVHVGPRGCVCGRGSAYVRVGPRQSSRAGTETPRGSAWVRVSVRSVSASVPGAVRFQGDNKLYLFIFIYHYLSLFLGNQLYSM